MASEDVTGKESKSFFYKDELSLKEVLAVLRIFKGMWKQALIFFLVPVVILGSLGYLASITSPNEYDAKCVLITDQVATPPAGGLQGLAGLAGISPPSSGGSESLGADLYPMVLSNKPFLIELSQQMIYVEKYRRSITLEDYFNNRKIKENIVSAFLSYITHPSKIKEIFKKEPAALETPVLRDTVNRKDSLSSRFFFSNKAYISELTPENKKMIEILSDRIKFTQSGKLITLSVKMPEARLSAEATKIVLNQLIRYVTKFKTGKQLENLEFLEARTAESEIKYKESQQRLAGFKDNNYHVIFESIQSREQQLQNEFSLAFSIYNQFVTQLQQAQIQLKKETPLFTVVEPVYIPEATSTDANKLIGSYATTGALIGLLLVFYLLGKKLFKTKKKQSE